MHTPGPWEVRSILVGPLQIVAGNEVLAMVGHETFASCAANAELIAAAPELLEALRGLLSVFDSDAPIEVAAAEAVLAKLDTGAEVTTGDAEIKPEDSTPY